MDDCDFCLLVVFCLVCYLMVKFLVVFFVFNVFMNYCGLCFWFDQVSVGFLVCWYFVVVGVWEDFVLVLISLVRE